VKNKNDKEENCLADVLRMIAQISKVRNIIMIVITLKTGFYFFWNAQTKDTMVNIVNPKA